MSALFPTTHWSVVLAGADSGNPESRQALEVLCRQYWYPIYAHARFLGHGPDAAQDLTQGFFTYVLEKHALKVADPQRGRFRAFLKGTFAHFVANERRTARAQKRGGGKPDLSFDLDTAESRYRLEPVEASTPEQSFERAWARTLLARSLDRLATEMEAEGAGPRYRRLEALLTEGSDDASYGEIGRDLNMSEGAVKGAVHRMRRRFGRILRDEVAHTLGDPEHVEDELRHLFAVLDS
jgi:DNA-directed RNA polymerase specialized sigma24 family protein